MRRLISSGSTFESQIGYSRAVVSGEWVFVSGTTGYDYSTMTISDDVEEQTRQALTNIGAALTDAGASFADVVRVHYLLPDIGDFEKTWPALQEVFAEVRPAATAFEAKLSSAEMKIEIEVTAHLGQA
jgi:enamine deaminase RidA (YjgF/YER057c/UK114 family)